jgi:hypothetical protein
MLPGIRSDRGALFVTTDTPTAADPRSGGVTMNNLGALKVSTDAPQSFEQGHGFTLDGSLCIDIAGNPVFGYINGLPVTITGALKCQLNTAFSLHDTIVGGIRVGPNGGIYLIDTTPDIPGGFDNGFSNGFNVFGGHVPPVGFTPLDLFIAGEQGAWYDPSDFSTMFQDSAGTTPVTAVGQPVGKIDDKSGNGNHASQATAASRPVLQIDGNGKHYLEFDGVDDSLETAAIDFTATDKMSAFLGIDKVGASSWQVACELSGNSDSNNGSFGLYSSVGDATMYGLYLKGGTGQSVTNFGPYTAPIINVVYLGMDLAAPSVGLSTEGQVNAGIPSGFAQGGTVPGAMDFGTYPLYLGARSGVQDKLNGRIYSLIVRGAASTPQEITDTETWVNGKTGAY